MAAQLITPLPTIPLRWVLAAILVVAAVLGWATVKARLANQASTIATQQEQIGKLNAQLAFEFVTRKVTTEYVERIKVVREKGDTIIKEIPVYVSAEADARCDVPTGFVRVHDAAVQNEPVAGTPVAADAAPSGLALSAVATTVAGNYETCHLIREQLIGLQSWLEETHVQADATP